jgi:hypothetical protein
VTLTATTTVWVLGRYPQDPGEGEQWMLQGVFTSREAAHAAGKTGDFVGPVPLDTPLPREREQWPDAEYVD